MKFFKILLFLLVLSPINALARENISDWYIKDFKTKITVNNDSSLSIEETIIADCGDLPDKHGIFRVLPTRQKYSKTKSIESPVELIEIVDENGKPYRFNSIKDPFNKTLTWKIGDPDITVTGENIYNISYKVKNAIRKQQNFDELYWNLSGNYWEIPVDKFSAQVTFPKEVNSENLLIDIYSGKTGDKAAFDVSRKLTGNVLEVSTDKVIAPGEGITLSASFPQNIISPYKPSFSEKFLKYFYFLLPILVFIALYKLWEKFGKDPKVSSTIAPEFEIPENLSPIEMGLVQKDGLMLSRFVTAGIINLAVNGHITIEEIERNKFLNTKDYIFTRIKGGKYLSVTEKKLLGEIFKGKDSTKLSDIDDKFYLSTQEIEKASKADLESRKLISSMSRIKQLIFFSISVVFGMVSYFSLFYNIWLFVALEVSALIIFVFSFLMSQRTLNGIKLLRRIEGFKLYMKKAEIYRQQFNEKENIFEQFLPYAILFGMTKLWIKKMKSLYGQDYFNSYHPVWFVGSFGSFNINTFENSIQTMSSNISSTASASGSGGGGFSGGGGGGGGGGGW